MRKKWLRWLLMPLLLLVLVACETVATPDEMETTDAETAEVLEASVVEGEYYSTPQEVVDYLDLYGDLPPNYLTKEEARELGWVAKEGNLWDIAPDATIGGDYFGNFEELLPEADDRDYFEADVNYEGGHRNAERVVFSNDGLYFYTDDHYESFVEMEPGGELD